MAAYLVGSRGTARHALLLGLIVTASHTAGVYVLGGVTLYASRYIVPERLYPWLGAVSGLIIAALGFALFLRRYAGRDEHHGHDHQPRPCTITTITVTITRMITPTAIASPRPWA